MVQVRLTSSNSQHMYIRNLTEGIAAELKTKLGLEMDVADPAQLLQICLQRDEDTQDASEDPQVCGCHLTC